MNETTTPTVPPNETIRPVPEIEPFLSAKELAYYLGRHVNYIYLMKKAGFPMPGRRATLSDAIQWLEANPNWRHYLPQGTR